MTIFDSAGVILTRLRNGKYRAERVGVVDGRVVIIKSVTNDRAMTWAHRAAAEDFEDLVTDIARGKVELATPADLEYKEDEK